MDVFSAGAVFVFGAVIGSFLNVVIYRLPRGKSIVRPSSRCSFCRSPIPAFLNLPIFGYFLARGRCLKCGHSFSMRYAAIELLTATIFLAVWINYGWSQVFVVFSILSCLLICASFIDLDLKMIPDEINLGGSFLFVFLALFVSEGFGLQAGGSWIDSPWLGVAVANPFWVSLFGAVFGYSFLWVVSRSFYWITGDEGLGLGDAKLMALVGSVLGVQGVVLSVVIGAASGALIGLGILASLPKGKRRRFPIPFGPFLCFGAFVGIFQLDYLLWNLLDLVRPWQ
ncbi:MAG: prepilin peptidase [Bradymonadales bacterium]|nr:MAG: prepilin peptidase [Bradymonadales bacterium]